MKDEAGQDEWIETFGWIVWGAIKLVAFVIVAQTIFVLVVGGGLGLLGYVLGPIVDAFRSGVF